MLCRAFLSRPLSFLGWTTAMLFLLAGLPSNTIKPLQMIQNAAACLVFNEPKSAHVTPLFVSLHWLPVAARIQFKTLMLAYRTTTGSAPTYFHSLLRIYIPTRSPAYFHSLLRIYIPTRSPAYFHSLLRIYIPSRSLRSASERRLVVPSQRLKITLQNILVHHSWSTPPPPSGPLDPWQSSSNNWKLISFYTTWLHTKLKKNVIFLFISFPC